jgi:hypothetical protein
MAKPVRYPRKFRQKLEKIRTARDDPPEPPELEEEKRKNFFHQAFLPPKSVSQIICEPDMENASPGMWTINNRMWLTKPHRLARIIGARPWK